MDKDSGAIIGKTEYLDIIRAQSQANLKADYQAAVRFGVFRIGREAIYFPSFPVGAKYIPLTALDAAWVQKSAMSPSGCCGGQIPVFVLHVGYGNELYQNITIEKERDANRALDLLREYQPDLPGAPAEKAAGAANQSGTAQ